MQSIKIRNIYSKVPKAKDKEVFQILAQNRKFKIERIISCGQVTKNGRWFKQAHDEWVMVLKGAGILKFRNVSRSVKLSPGDYIFIPANISHRVEWTDVRKKTIWLAVHAK